MELDDLVVIVTGGGRGIGGGIAQAMAVAGAAVAVVARSSSDVDETAGLIRAGGGQAAAFSVDVTDRAAVERLVREVEAKLGPVAILVNNAGRLHTIGPVWDVDPDEWWRDVEVNLRSAFLCSWAVLPGMIERRSGRIINVATDVALRPSPYTSSYATSKAAVLRLTEGLAESTRDFGVRIFAVSPGMVRTAMTERMLASREGQTWLPELRNAAWGTADAIARLVVQLATGRGDALSGRYLHVRDDVEALVARRDEIQRDDLLTLRLRRGRGE